MPCFLSQIVQPLKEAGFNASSSHSRYLFILRENILVVYYFYKDPFFFSLKESFVHIKYINKIKKQNSFAFSTTEDDCHRSFRLFFSTFIICCVNFSQ
jgi:hypothetical protein